MKGISQKKMIPQVRELHKQEGHSWKGISGRGNSMCRCTEAQKHGVTEESEIMFLDSCGQKLCLMRSLKMHDGDEQLGCRDSHGSEILHVL